MPLIEQVLEKNPESVNIAFKNLPLQMHKQAGPAALAALAAGEQGKFWEYHDKLFAERKIEKSDFNRIATELGLDLNKFKADMSSPQLRGHLRADMDEAKRNGITGTPTIFVNGRKLKQRTMGGFQKMIDEELSKKNPTN